MGQHEVTERNGLDSTYLAQEFLASYENIPGPVTVRESCMLFLHVGVEQVQDIPRSSKSELQEICSMPCME